MSDLIKRHRAAAESWRHGEGSASAALCEFHDDTADEIERLRAMMKKYIRLIIDAEGFDFLSDYEWDATDWETWQEIIAELDSDYAQERAAEEKP